MSDAARKAYRDKNKSRVRFKKYLDNVAGLSRFLAATIAPVALAIIGFLTWSVGVRTLEFSKTSNVQHLSLVRELDRLERERLQLSNDILEMKAEYAESVRSVGDANQELEALTKQNDALKADYSKSLREKSIINEHLSEAKAALLDVRKTKIMEEFYFRFVLATTQADQVRGYSLHSGEIINRHGQFEMRHPIEFYYPHPRENFWNMIVQSLRLAAKDVPDEFEGFLNAKIESFVDSCAPRASPSAFYFNEPLPAFEAFDSVFDVYEENGNKPLSPDEMKLFNSRIESAQLKKENNLQTAKEFVDRFNEARARYLMAQQNEIYSCVDYPFDDYEIVDESSDEFDSFKRGAITPEFARILFSSPNNREALK